MKRNNSSSILNFFSKKKLVPPTSSDVESIQADGMVEVDKKKLSEQPDVNCCSLSNKVDCETFTTNEQKVS